MPSLQWMFWLHMICTDITLKHGNILVCKITLKSSLRANCKQLTNVSIPFYLGDCYPTNTVSYRAAREQWQRKTYVYGREYNLYSRFCVSYNFHCSFYGVLKRFLTLVLFWIRKKMDYMKLAVISKHKLSMRDLDVLSSPFWIYWLPLIKASRAHFGWEY